MNLFASLDLGSNSCRLVIAKKHPVTQQLIAIDELKENVRLAEGLVHNEDYITDIASERTLSCLKRFGEMLKNIPKENIRAVATNTVRVAKNQAGFLHKATAALGIPLEVISGTEEARLIFLGVQHQLSIQEQQEKKLVIDIGGGSTEMILGASTPIILESLHLGCVTYSQNFFSDIDKPVTKKQYEQAYQAVLETVEPFLSLYKNNDAKWNKVYASSGTAKAMAQFLFANDLCAFETITIEGIEKIKTILFAAKNLKELMNFKGVKEERLSVLAGGLVILEGLMNSLHIRSLCIGHGALRWGVLVELADVQKHYDVQQETIRYWVQNAHLDTTQIERVLSTSNYLWKLIHHSIPSKAFPELLKYSIYLHEWGLMVSHENAFLHTSYLFQHVDLAGFSKSEQYLLAQLTLIQNHKTSYKAHKNDKNDKGNKSNSSSKKQQRQEQIQVAFEYLKNHEEYAIWLKILRLSLILCRSRCDIMWQNSCYFDEKTQQFVFDTLFLKQYSLTAHQLENELIAQQNW